MGQFTEGSIIIECNSEKSAEEIFNAICNLDEYIAKKLDGQPFSTTITDTSYSDTSVYVSLCSDRYPNAEWQCQQIFELVKEDFKGKIYHFEADLTVPENVIYAEFDDEGNEI